MIELPRLGLAVAGTGPEPSMAGLALLAGLNSRRLRVQHFRSKACPTSTGVVRQLTGLPGRHLDAWLMPPEVCRAIFIRGAEHADLAIVEGTYDQPSPSLEPAHYHRPGGLGPIARALDLPTVAVVPCPRWGDFHLPNLPPSVDAILLDDLADPADFDRFRHLVSSLTRKPVVGAVESLPEIRRALADVSTHEMLPDDVVGQLAASFLRFADLDLLNEMARSRLITPICRKITECAARPRVRVAYAQDEIQAVLLIRILYN